MKSLTYIATSCMLLMSLCNPVFGQSKWSLSASFAPIYSYANAHNTQYLPDLNGGNQPVPVDFRSQSRGYGYTVGLMGRYAVSSKWSFSTGLLFRQMHLDVPDITTDPFVLVISGSSRTNNYQIPLLINYQTSTRRLSPYFSVGVDLDFRSTSYLTIRNGQEGSVSLGKSGIGFEPRLGAGISYRLNDHLSLLTQPSINYILPKSDYISFTSYKLSLQTQLLYKF